MKYGRVTCQPHKGGGIPLSAFPMDTTSKLAGLFSTVSLFMLSAKQGSCEYYFLKSFGKTRLRNEPQVYRLQRGRSNHCTIAPVITYFAWAYCSELLYASFFLDVGTCIECRTVLFNLFVIEEPLMYFRVCHGTPTNKNLETTNCLQTNQIFRYCNSKNN